MRQDRQGVRTPQALERKYDLGAIEKLKRCLGLDQDGTPEVINLMLPIGSIVVREDNPDTVYPGTAWVAVDWLEYGWKRVE